MPKIIHYISGHGYGHTTRSLELIKALMRRRNDLFFHVRTSAPKWLFDLNLKKNYELTPKSLDVGAVQKLSFEIDIPETYRRVAAIHAGKSQIVAEEAAFAGTIGAALVIGDVPPLAFDIAEAAGVPGVALANFSWDWIYAGWLDRLPGFAEPIADIRASYAKADLLLRLPMHGDLSCFREIRDIPLIARKSVLPRHEIRRRIGIAPEDDVRLALVALRADDVQEVDLRAAASGSNLKLITMGSRKKLDNVINLPPDFIYFPELVNACDVVVSKPGYGLVSEIIANHKPLLYTSRDDFVEYEILVAGLRRWAISEFLPREQFYRGEWLPALDRLSRSRAAWPEVELNGAEVAAGEILKFL